MQSSLSTSPVPPVTLGTPVVVADRNSIFGVAVWTVIAAFGTYFCMYLFRKPFTAATFSESPLWWLNAGWGLSEKKVLVIAQVMGYMVSKFISVRVIAEMPQKWRAAAILALIGTAEAALLLFGLAPAPLHVLCLFLNGLPLGMVFGLVLRFLEGRRHTEALAAGLCASFILADGVTKSVGKWLLDLGVPDRWMPAAAGMLFVLPLLVFVWMLSRIPAPNAIDVAHRSERLSMHRSERAAMLRRYGLGLFSLVAMYLLITIARSMRADFAPELWRGLGVTVVPSTFTWSELIVALAILLIIGLGVLIVDNSRAFFTALLVALMGSLLMIVALVGQRQGWISGFPFMVLLGLGLYLPYVAMHTTIFERLIAMTRDRGNIGFLMCVADAIGYLGYVAVLLGEGLLPATSNFLQFFTTACWLIAVLSCACLALSWMYFARRTAAQEASA